MNRLDWMSDKFFWLGNSCFFEHYNDPFKSVDYQGVCTFRFHQNAFIDGLFIEHSLFFDIKRDKFVLMAIYNEKTYQRSYSRSVTFEELFDRLKPSIKKIIIWNLEYFI